MGGEISGRRGFIPETVKPLNQAVRARRGGMGGSVWLYIITGKPPPHPPRLVKVGRIGILIKSVFLCV